MTTAYWFDLDGTLLGYDRSFDAMLEDCLGGSQPERVHETFRQAMFVALESFDDVPYEHGFEVLRSECDLDIDVAEMTADFRDIELAATEVVPGSRSILASMAERGPVGILTNGDGEMQRAKIQRHDLDELVDAVIVSNEVDTRKPEREIFDIAREHLSADRYVYVGDSYEEDIVGAREAGFTAIHVRNDDGPELSIDRLQSLNVLLETTGDTH